MSNKGFLILAQNNGTDDYIRQAYALALSIKITQPTYNSVSLLTNDQVPEEYKSAFDNVIEIPWQDHAADAEWKIQNRWKFIHVSPYDETIVLDADMIMLSDMTSKWELLANHDVFFASQVTDHRERVISRDIYNRQTFIANNLPNVYFAFHYFKKTPKAFEFYKTLELVVNNWETMHSKITPNVKQKWLSMDVSAAIAVKILGIEAESTNKNLGCTFVHMKPNLQGWSIVPAKWTNVADCYFDNNMNLFVNQFKQAGLFHYTEKEFLTDSVVRMLEDRYV